MVSIAGQEKPNFKCLKSTEICHSSGNGLGMVNCVVPLGQSKCKQAVFAPPFKTKFLTLVPASDLPTINPAV